MQYWDKDEESYRRSNSVWEVAHGPFSTGALGALMEEGADRGALSAELVGHLCDEFGIARAEVVVSGRYRPKPGRVVVYGEFVHPKGGVPRLTVYNHSRRGAMERGIPVPADQFVDTLLQMFMHYYDREVLGLARSARTAGFYARVADLKRKLG